MTIYEMLNERYAQADDARLAVTPFMFVALGCAR